MKILRKLLCFTTALTLLTTSCSIPNNFLNDDREDNKNKNFDKSLIQKADFKTKAVEPQLLHFDSKVPNQTFSIT